MTDAAEPKKKRNLWLWIGGGCLGVVVLGMATCGIVGYYFIKDAMITDPAKVEELAREILPLTKPEGTQGLMGVKIMGFKMAFLGQQGAKDTGLSVVLFSVPAEQKNQFDTRDYMRKQRGNTEVVQTLPEQTFKLRGQDIVATVQVVKSESGKQLSQYSFNITDAGKVTGVVFMGPEDVLTKERVQATLDTVK
jgi:hypothetical protein